MDETGRKLTPKEVRGPLSGAAAAELHLGLGCLARGRGDWRSVTSAGPWSVSLGGQSSSLQAWQQGQTQVTGASVPLPTWPQGHHSGGQCPRPGLTPVLSQTPYVRPVALTRLSSPLAASLPAVHSPGLLSCPPRSLGPALAQQVSLQGLSAPWTQHVLLLSPSRHPPTRLPNPGAPQGALPPPPFHHRGPASWDSSAPTPSCPLSSGFPAAVPPLPWEGLRQDED